MATDKYRALQWEHYVEYWDAFRLVLARARPTLPSFEVHSATPPDREYWIMVDGTGGHLRGSLDLHPPGRVGLNFMTSDPSHVEEILDVHLSEYEYTPIQYAATGRLLKSAQFQRFERFQKSLVVDPPNQDEWRRQHEWLAAAIAKALVDFRRWAK